jgi:hypothetical protein
MGRPPEGALKAGFHGLNPHPYAGPRVRPVWPALKDGQIAIVIDRCGHQDQGRDDREQAKQPRQLLSTT